jgi:uncharacterized protein (TIGR02594 family)
MGSMRLGSKAIHAFWDEAHAMAMNYKSTIQAEVKDTRSFVSKNKTRAPFLGDSFEDASIQAGRDFKGAIKSDLSTNSVPTLELNPKSGQYMNKGKSSFNHRVAGTTNNYEIGVTNKLPSKAQEASVSHEIPEDLLKPVTGSPVGSAAFTTTASPLIGSLPNIGNSGRMLTGALKRSLKNVTALSGALATGLVLSSALHIGGDSGSNALASSMLKQSKQAMMQVTKLSPENAAVINLTKTPIAVTQSSSQNIVIGSLDLFDKVSVKSIAERIKADPNYKKNLPTLLTMSGKQDKNVKLLAEQLQSPVVTSYTNNVGSRDYGTIHYPSKYTPLTKIRPIIKDPEHPWMDAALKYKGMREDAQLISSGEGNNRGPEIDTILRNAGVNPETGSWSWCASFVNQVFKDIDHSTVGKPAGALNWRKFGVHLKSPAYGAVGVIDNGAGHGHAFFVAGRDHKNPNLIIGFGGNQDDGVNYMVFDTSKRDINFMYPKGYKAGAFNDLPTYDTTVIAENSFTELPRRLK